jgi:hypothetical protein
MKKEMEYNGYLGIHQPWGARGYYERCAVEFLPDKEFKMNLDGEQLSGYYTYCHNGYINTAFTVYLDTGESFTGISVSGYGFRRLSFEFRGVLYEFGEITVYDAKHFWYKGQSYVIVGDLDFGFLFEN